MESFSDFIANYMRVADFRGISFENPVRFKLQPDDRKFIMVAAFSEPSFSQTPFNVAWLCYDSADTEYYGKVWRRTSEEPSEGKRYTWEEVTSLEDLYSEDQYYRNIDETPSWDLGLSWVSVGPATSEIKGYVLISDQTDGTGTQGVLDTDERLSNKRVPKEHDHPDYPRTMVHIAGTYQEDPQYGDRVNDGEVFVRFSVAKLPTGAGQVFKLTHNNPTRPNEWFGEWAVPKESDFSGEPAVLVSANPYTSDGSTSLEDNAEYQLVVDSLYSNNTTIVGDTGIWSVSDNAEGITINPNTGLLSVPDVNNDVVVSITVTTTDIKNPEIKAQGTLSLNIRDTYTPIVPVSAVILGPDSINEKNGTEYELQVTYSDGSRLIQPAKTFNSSDLLTATITNSGDFDAKDITQDTTVTLTATYEELGVEVSATKNVLVIAEIEVIGINIVAPTSMNELTSINAQASVSLSDGSSYIANTADVTWEFIQTATGVTAGAGQNSITYTSAVDIDADETFSVKVSGTFDGIYVEDVHDITVKDVTEPQIPVFFEIIGADTIEEGSTGEPYSFQVTYDSGASAIVNANADSFVVNNIIDAAATADQLDGDNNIILGTLDSISNITSDTTVTLTASYTENGSTVNGSKSVIIVAEPAIPVGLTISGPTEMTELESIELSASAEMDDGSSIVVSGDSSSHNLTWEFIQTANGILDTNTATTREFNSTVDLSEDESFTVRATVIIEGVSVSDEHTVTVLNVPVLPVSLAIVGSTSVSENSAEAYTFEVTWSDDSVTNVVPTSVNTSDAKFTLNTSGDASIGEFGADTTVSLNATFTAKGETVNATLPVVVEDIPTPVSVVINGPDMIGEQLTQAYTFEVTWSDDSITSVALADAVDSTNTDTQFELNGNLVVGDIVTDTTTDLTATVTVDGVELTSEAVTVTLTADPVPVSLEINGPATIDEGSTGDYTFTVTMSDDSTKTVTAGSFVADNPLASISDNTVTGNEVTTDTLVGLTAEYTEGTVTVSGTSSVTIVDVPKVTSLEIVGPTTAGEQTTTSYTFTVTFDDNSTKNVQASNAGTDTSGFSFNTSGTLTTPSVDTPTAIVLSASYSENGVTVNDTHNVNVTNDIVVTLDSITVVGPGVVAEGGVAGYTATANYSDGSSPDITDIANWSATQGSIDGGSFTAPQVNSDTGVTITASYDSVSGTTLVNVTDVPVPTSIEISGPVTVNEGGDTISLSAVVTYSDTSTANVTTSASWSSSNPSNAAINSTGTVTSGSVDADTDVTFTVSYTENGSNVTDTHVVSVVNEASSVYGPRWGTIGPQANGMELRSIADFDETFLQALDKPLTGVDGESFFMEGGVDSFDNPDGGFAPYVHNRVFVAYPASMGWARFVDDFGNAGGFDGATALPDGGGAYTDMGGTVNLSQYANNGGIQVTINGEDYIIYSQYMSSQNADYTMTLTYGGTRRISGEL